MECLIISALTLLVPEALRLCDFVDGVVEFLHRVVVVLVFVFVFLCEQLLIELRTHPQCLVSRICWCQLRLCMCVMMTFLAFGFFMEVVLPEATEVARVVYDVVSFLLVCS